MEIILLPIRFCGAIASYQLGPFHERPLFAVPSLGTIMMLLAYLSFVLGLEFIGDSVPGAQFWQERGVRAGWLAVAQMPLLVLLVGKMNWITFATGVSYERLNVLHRWSSRIMLLLAIFHFAFQAKTWQEYPHIFHLEWTIDLCVPTGLAAFVLLLWMNLSTLAPIRRYSYELFVAQHILTFFGFIIAIMMHLPTTALNSRILIYVPIAVYLTERLVRTAYYAWINSNTGRATLIKHPGRIVEIRTRFPKTTSWRPGSHVLFSIPALGLGQSHPATVASSPQSHGGDLVLLLKSHRGFTKSLLAHADDSASGPAEVETPYQGKQHRILIDGPYGGQRVDFAAFDSICFLAGSTGISFISSLLHGVLETAKRSGGELPLRRIHLAWAVKAAAHLSWVEAELVDALNQLSDLKIEVEGHFFVTGDNSSVNAQSPNPGSYELQQKVLPNQQSAGDLYRPTRHSGRPDVAQIIQNTVVSAGGECGIAVCGPFGMNTRARNAVASIATRRLLTGGSHKPVPYLHVEGFAY